MKETWSKLLVELLRNSRQSDREIARKLGVSQPTVSRTRSSLEKEGYIKEYTIIPNFSKFGYKIMAITFALSKTLDAETAKKARAFLIDGLEQAQTKFIMVERGIGLGFDAAIITFHRDYSSYVQFMKCLKQVNPAKFVDVEKIGSFLIDLDDEVRYFPLSFSRLANESLSEEEKKTAKSLGLKSLRKRKGESTNASLTEIEMSKI